MREKMSEWVATAVKASSPIPTLPAPRSLDCLCAASCVDGPRLARENFAYPTEVACSVGTTDCAITRHCSLASSNAKVAGGLSRHGPGLVLLLAQHHRPGDARRHASIGSNSNAAENGLDAEKDRADIFTQFLSQRPLLRV